MPLATGFKLGPYQIVAALGAGGMGEVYKGRDTRLDRTVAIKVLPAEFAVDPQFRARFEREAKAIAALSHPHICTLHDVGRQDDTEFLVMEYLEGETLADRLARLRGPLPIDQVLTFGTQVADALDKAHRAGIVHRDLKPANVMLTKAGAKLLDFGLAKLRPPVAPFGLSTLQGTTTADADTATGTILGTIHYMSPEQVEGREADKRSDIWALGAVLHEMATGRRPFDGTSPASVIGAILKDEPGAISKSQPMAPATLDHLVERCLAKDPDERWQDAGDVKRELMWVARASPTPRSQTAVNRSSRVGLLSFAAGLLLASLAASVLFWPRETTSAVSRAVLSIVPPDGTRFGNSFAFSPDGSHMAFVAQGREGAPTLWVRAMGATSAQQIGNTEDAAYPFWSPDGNSIGFFAGGRLKTVAVSGGATKVLAAAPNARGGSWGQDGTILYVPESNGPVFRVPASGGPSEPATQMIRQDHQLGHRWPLFVDATRFLFTVQGAPDAVGIYLGVLGSQKTTRLVNAYSNSAVANGRMTFVLENRLLTQSLDAVAGTLTGTPVEVAGPIWYVNGFGFGAFSASTNGTVAFLAGSGSSATVLLQWLDRQGKIMGPMTRDAEVSLYNSYNPRIARDRHTVAYATFRSPTADVWLVDVARDVAQRFTNNEASDINPVLSADGSRVLFASNRTGEFNLYVKGTSGTGDELALTAADVTLYPSDWSPDGQSVLFTKVGADRQSDVMTMRASSGAEARPVAASPFNEYLGRFSPDGQWVAYTSDESGRPEVYVQRFPSGTDRVKISTLGGFEADWRGDGRELYYLTPNRILHAVPLTLSPTFSAGRPVPLFDTPVDTTVGSIHSWHYAAAPDGKSFLMSVAVSTPTSITIVLNLPK